MAEEFIASLHEQNAVEGQEKGNHFPISEHVPRDYS